MTASEVYLTIIIASVSGLWFVWDLAIKKLFLDSFRERLFEMRFRLFELGESGALSFDSEAYRTTETLLCGLLRYGHRATFLVLILSLREQARRRRDREYVDTSQQIELKISRSSPAVQKELLEILAEVHRAVVVYIAVSSLLFMLAAVVLVVLRGLNLIRHYGKREISAVLEAEAYRAESFHHSSTQTVAV